MANEKYLNMPPLLSDYIAVEPILKQTASGLSIESIARDLNMSEHYISEVLMEYFRFSGWIEDLKYNPLFIYNMSKGKYSNFLKKVREMFPDIDEGIAYQSFFLCRVFDKVDETIRDYYDKQD